MNKKGKANHIDVEVGQRVRARRMEMDMTQEDLAERLELTFQQVQKYEQGKNRVSASRLHQISQALDAPVSYFFGGDKGKQPVCPFDSQTLSIARLINDMPVKRKKAIKTMVVAMSEAA